MLNPMVQSDLVTYRGVTILILFLQATNKINVKYLQLSKDRTFLSSRVYDNHGTHGKNENVVNSILFI